MPTIPPMPKLPLGFLGPQAKFKEFHLDVFSYTNPIIRLFTGNEVQIKIGYTFPTEMTFELINMDTNKDCSKYVFKETDQNDQVLKFIITLPKKGSYKFMMHALPVSKPGTTLENVYNYLILCARISKKARPCPRQHKEWSDGFKLQFPKTITRESAAEGEVKFRLTAPPAKAVAVVIDQEWTELSKYSDEGEWGGAVPITKKHFDRGEAVTINVKFQEDCPTYCTVLEYEL